MKTILLVAAVAIMSLTVNAQEKSKGLQGIWWAAGQVSFGSSETGTAKSTNNMILPIVGTFISPSVTVALGIGNINSKTKDGSTTLAESNTFVIKPLARKYWNVSGGLFFFGQAALPVMMGKDKITDDKTSSVALELAPGFDYVINKWLTVETSFTVFNVGSSTTTPKVGEKTTNFNFNANPMNSVGDRKIGDLQVGVKFLF
ncbi:outer membrane beta-barrel protein [Flavobacterium frigoris]|uniref:Outer membrane protein beta-barrel domain-containing protein n=1 Tax=Flavobacterium frigoris TaxID=229204 RepID=A0A1H9KSD7_FLAFI|nr:outer membrane beta-barrel protein [Flavobacterium frigoris]SER02042.1 Outer membrane protein beta-barrel domain-containing protein [Flavobacterium frigoris]